MKGYTELPGKGMPSEHAGVTVTVDKPGGASSRGSDDSPRRTDAASMAAAGADRKHVKLERIQTLHHAGLATDPEVFDPDAPVEELLGLAEHSKVPWIRRKGNLAKVILNVISALVIAAGIVLATPVSPEQLYAFRWPIFFGAIFPFFCISRWLTNKVYHIIEVCIYKEPLFHFRSLKKSTKTLMFFLLVLVWYFLVFELLWCRYEMYNGVCKEPAYVEVTRTIMKIILCCTLGSLATFLAALVAKLISTHFLKSTHFRKLHVALEKEYYMKILSDPKQRRQESRPNMSSRGTSQFMGGMTKQARTSAANLLEVLTEGSPTAAAKESKHRHCYSFDEASFQAQGHDHEGKDPRRASSQRSSYDDLPSLANLHVEGKPGRASSTDDGASTGPSSPTSMQDHRHRMHHYDSGDDTEMNMGKSALEAVQAEFLQSDERDVATMTEEEIDRLRTAVVIKTSSSMMRQHKFRTKAEKEAQLQRTREFAKLLFHTIKGSDSWRQYITYQDVELFFPDSADGRRDARSAFGLFASNRSAKVYRQQVTDTVLNIYKDRSNISASLSNTDTMVKSLQGCLAAGLHFLFLAFYLLIWRIDILAGFSAFSATVLALSFIFGNTIRNLFESMLFLFVEHPYDIGDWVEIEGKAYEVVKISLMNTVFHATGMIRTVIPNSTLIPKEIRNMSRLDMHLEIMTIQVDFGMADVVKEEIHQSLVRLTKQYSNEYMPAPIWVVYTGVDTNMKANLLVLWTYDCAPADWDRKHPARDRAVKLVTGIVAKHQPNGASYTYNHRLANGVPADLMGMAAGNQQGGSDAQAAASAALLSAQQMMQQQQPQR
eukprot:jgi/Tetstr1/425459/TSEL_015906.t1